MSQEDKRRLTTPRRHSTKQATERDTAEVSFGVVCLRNEFIAREPRFIPVTEQQADLREFMGAGRHQN